MATKMVTVRVDEEILSRLDGQLENRSDVLREVIEAAADGRLFVSRDGAMVPVLGEAKPARSDATVNRKKLKKLGADIDKVIAAWSEVMGDVL